MPMERETLTASEVATLFGISANSVYRAARSGTLRPVETPVRRVLFARREIEQLLRIYRRTAPGGSQDAPHSAMQQVAA
jgi:predicted site-specific integrase-resolvase